MFGSHRTGFVAGLALTAFALGCRETGVKIYHEPPSVTITSPSDGTNYYAGESIEFIALVQSTGDDLTEITHEWMAGSDLICESAPVPADGQPSCVHAFTEPGVQSVEITLTDTRLDRASATSTVNLSPTVTDHKNIKFYCTMRASFEKLLKRLKEKLGKMESAVEKIEERVYELK